MIYKKTQVPCPLPYYQNAHNLSLNGSDAMGLYQMPTNFPHAADISPVVADSAASVHLEPHADAEDMCTPKYFVFNSQVRCWRRRIHGLNPKKVKRSRLTEACQSRGDTLCIYPSVK